VSDPTGLPLDPALRALGKVLHERYQLAARIARATWVAEETSPEAMVAASATVFIEINKQLGHATDSTVGPTAPTRAPVTSNSAAAPSVHGTPVCPCGTVMVPVQKKNPNMPDWRCPSCDKALWNRTRKAAL
jgi:hypothetical protein